MPDNYRARQILIITAIAIFAFLLGYAVYRILTAGGKTAPISPPQAPVIGSVGGFAVETPTLPYATPLQQPTLGLEQKIQEQTLLALANFSVVSPVINKKQDGVLFYKKEGGSVYAADFAANIQKNSNITIVGLTEANWSPARDRAGVFYIDTDVLKSFLHTGSSSALSLPRDITSFSWSPDGKQFAYLLEMGEGGVGLFISDASGKNTKQEFSTPILDAQIQWITPDTIIFQTAPSGQASGFVFKYSVASRTLRRVFGPLYGLTTLWSPDAAHALMSITNGEGKNMVFYLYDASTNESKRLDFITLPDKCVWLTTKEFYCAAPNAFPSQATMPDDYLRGETVTQDRILSYNLDTQETTLIFSGGAMDIANLAVTTKKDYLIFVNRTDGILWRYKLAQ